MPETPLITVIIPALNEEQHVGKCLSSVRNGHIPKEKVEIILIDNGSEDGTVEIAKGYGALVYSVNGGTISKLRNYGALKAKGKILAFMDADCIVTKNWLISALNELKDDSVGATGCNYKLQGGNSWVAEAWEFNMGRPEGRHETEWIQSGNLIIKKDIFNLVGGFDEKLTVCEDSDICYRIKNKGYKIMSNSEILSFHLGFADSASSFFRKELWHGKDLIKVFLKHKMKYARVMGFALFFSACLTSILIGLFLLKIKFMIFPLVLMIFLSVFLSLRLSIAKNEYNYFLPLIILYFVFGITRGISLLNLRNWKTRQ